MIPMYPIQVAAPSHRSTGAVAAVVPCTPGDWRLDHQQTALMDRLARDGTWTLSQAEEAGWEVLGDLLGHAQTCLSASTRGGNPALLLSTAEATSVRAALTSLPECLYRPHSDLVHLRGLIDKLGVRAECALTSEDLETLETARSAATNQHRGGRTGRLEIDRMLLRQQALFAQWIHDAPTQRSALNRESVVRVILVAMAHGREGEGPMASPHTLPFAPHEYAELPTPDLITEISYPAGKALSLSNMHRCRMLHASQFKESAARLGIEELFCSGMPEGKLPKGCDLQSLRLISLMSASPSTLDVADLFAKMRRMPRLRLVFLPLALTLPDIPRGWRHDPEWNTLSRVG
jgi:hypothetical protein